MKKNVFLLFILQVFVTVSYAQTLKDSLLVYFPFNGNAKDKSGNGHDAVFNTATLVADKDGNANSAYYFSGTDTIVIPNIKFTNAKGITISMWVKTNGGKGRRGIFWYPPFVWYEGLVTQDHFMAVMDANSSNNATSDESQSSIATGAWTHLVATSDGTITRLYINGSLEKSYSETLTDHSTFNHLDIGGAGLTSPAFTGAIDEFRMYVRTLSATEVANVYQKGTPLGINNDENSAINLNIYPNPTTNGVFAISMDKQAINANLVVSNMAGQKVFEQKVSTTENFPIDLSAMPKGIYLLNVVTSNGVVNKRIIYQ